VSVPGLNDPTNTYYDAYSIPVSGFSIPSQFDTYTPDNQNDYQCRVVLVPNPKKGATAWTMNGKFITIGVYRDQGRASGRNGQLAAQSWSRSGTTLTFITQTPHGLSVGDNCDFYNINVATFNTNVVTVIDNYTFTIRAFNTGSASGGTSAICWPSKIVDYNDDYIVFRLLPSFQLVTYATIESIFAATAPSVTTNTVSMYDITKSSYTQLPNQKSENFNYDLTTSITANADSDVVVLYNQQFDANGNPLLLTYQDNGQPTLNTNMNSVTDNAQIFYRDTIDNLAANSRVFVYDFYGLDINDPTRGPYFNPALVYRNPNATSLIGNFAYAQSAAGTPLYSGYLQDEFGNLAIGIQTNNALIVRKQILPVALDSFNKPIKQPTTILGV